MTATEPEVRAANARGEEARAMALDPSTAPEALRTLAQRFPVEVTENPIFPLLLLERPSLLDEWGNVAGKAIVSLGRLPASMLSAFVLDARADLKRLWAAANPSLPPELAVQLARNDADAPMQAAVAKNPSLPEAELRALARSKALPVREAAAANPLLPDDEVDRLSFDVAVDVRAVIADHPRLSAERVRALMADPSARVRLVASLHPRAAADLRALLAALDEEPRRSRPDAASGPVDPSIFAALLGEGPGAREMVALHPDAPPWVLERLARDSCWAVVVRAAHHPSTPVSALCAIERAPATRDALLRNPSTPSALLEAVADEVLPDATYARRDRRFAMARHPNATAALLERLSRAPDLGLHELVARHPAAGAGTLRALVRSKNPKARLAVARHASCPRSVLEALSDDDDARVRRAVSTRKRVSSAA